MIVIDTNVLEGVEPKGHFGGLTTVDVINADQAGNMVVQLSRGPVNSGAYSHAHENAEQLFYVLEGRLTIRTSDGQSVVLKPGMAAFIPRGEVHATKNEGAEPVVSLVVTSPPLG